MKIKFLSDFKTATRTSFWQRFFEGSFLLFSFFLPLHTGVSNIFLITSLLLAVIFLKQEPHFRVLTIKKRMLLYSVFPFFLLHLMGIFYTSHPDDSFRYIEKTLSFILVPIVFLFFRREQLTIVLGSILRGLFFGSFVSMLILLTYNLYHYFLDQGGFTIGKDLFDYYHTYQYFTKPLDQHPTYLGVYCLTSLIFMNRIINRTWIKIIFVAFFFLCFLFLNSRIIFFGMFLIGVLFIFKSAYKLFATRKYSLLFIYSLGLGIFLFTTLQYVSGTYIGYRIKNIYKFEISTENEEEFNSKAKANPRMARWISALELVKERPIFGYGVADEYPNLKKQFERDKMHIASKMGYNTHNQFIGYAVRFGVVGVFFLCFFFLSNVQLALANGNYRYASLLLIIFCVCIVENFFDRNYGITFSAVFFTIFSYLGWYHLNPQKVKVLNQNL